MSILRKVWNGIKVAAAWVKGHWWQVLLGMTGIGVLAVVAYERKRKKDRDAFLALPKPRPKEDRKADRRQVVEGLKDSHAEVDSTVAAIKDRLRDKFGDDTDGDGSGSQ